MSANSQKELTGRHVLMILFIFFGIIITINIYFMVSAVKTFRGEDVARSYRQGLEYNQTIAARAVQNDMGWSVRVNAIKGNKIILDIRDKDNHVIPNLTIEAKLRHPADMALDKTITFTQDNSGRYTANAAELEGRWLLIANARNETQQFKFEHEIWL